MTISVLYNPAIDPQDSSDQLTSGLRGHPLSQTSARGRICDICCAVESDSKDPMLVCAVDLR